MTSSIMNENTLTNVDFLAKQKCVSPLYQFPRNFLFFFFNIHIEFIIPNILLEDVAGRFQRDNLIRQEAPTWQYRL